MNFAAKQNLNSENFEVIITSTLFRCFTLLKKVLIFFASPSTFLKRHFNDLFF